MLSRKGGFVIPNQNCGFFDRLIFHDITDRTLARPETPKTGNKRILKFKMKLNPYNTGCLSCKTPFARSADAREVRFLGEKKIKTNNMDIKQSKHNSHKTKLKFSAFLPAALQVVI